MSCNLLKSCRADWAFESWWLFYIV